MRITTDSVAMTESLGETLGRAAPSNLVIALDGQLGAGKTHFSRGIARGALVADLDLVASPTYVIMNVYEASAAPGAKPVYHLDAYRLHGADDLEALGFSELLDSGGIIVIEWASRVRDLLPADHLAITLSVGDQPTSRLFEFSANGPRSSAVLAALAPLS